MAEKGAYRKKLYVPEREREDYSQVDKITSRVKPKVVEQDNGYKAVILESINNNRAPLSKDDAKELRRALRYFEPTIWEQPRGKKWCSENDHWVIASKDYFSLKADTRDGFHPVCKACRNAQARHNYATSLDREVRTYTRKLAA